MIKIETILRGVGLLGLTLGLARVSGAEYHVAIQGNDSHPGTASQPFRTISRAYGAAAAGTTIIVQPGVYTDYQSGWGLRINRNGTASSPITLRSQVRGGAVIDGQNSADRNVAVWLDGSHNILDGFEIRGGPKGGIKVWGNDNQIRNNDIHHNGNPASTSTYGQDGIYSDRSTRNNRYIANLVRDNGRVGSNLDHALYLCGDNELVANNVMIRNAAYGLHIAGYETVANLKAYNNVIAHNGKSGVILWMAVSGVDIRNNILFQNGRYGFDSWDAHGNGVVLDRNLVFGNGLGDYNFINGASDYSYSLGTTISSAPLFLNATPAAFDAHLDSGSPAISGGLNLSSVFTTDHDGVTRQSSGPWELGAYRYGVADTTPPSVSILAPLNGAILSGLAVAVSAIATDNVGVAGVQFKIDGANLGGEDFGAPYGMTLNTTTLPNGNHTLTAVARDTAGNQTTSSPITVNINNTPISPPAVALTSPANNASYPAPATIQLAADVTANGHTIGRIQFLRDGNLLGEDATSPYSFAWSNVGAGTYNLAARVVYDAGNTVTSPAVGVSVAADPSSGPTLDPASAVITPPFILSNGMISQPVNTGATDGGRAAFSFVLGAAGDYRVVAQVIAPDDSANSFFVNIDGEPADPAMIWDIPPTGGASERSVSWRGNGTFDNAEFAPKVFSLSTGAHTLLVRGREANTQLGTLTLIPVNGGNPPPAGLPVVTVTATDADASRVGPDPGAFAIARTGGVGSALTVNCSFGGTASNGTDYETLQTSVTIPAGAASVTLAVIPKPSSTLVDAKTVSMMLAASPAYTVGTPGSAGVTISGNSVPRSIKLSGNSATISWTSLPGRTYRVAYKASLGDPQWIDLSGDIAATGTRTSWTDRDGGRSTQRFYVVYATN